MRALRASDERVANAWLARSPRQLTSQAMPLARRRRRCPIPPLRVRQPTREAAARQLDGDRRADAAARAGDRDDASPSQPSLNLGLRFSRTAAMPSSRILGLEGERRQVGLDSAGPRASGSVERALHGLAGEAEHRQAVAGELARKGDARRERIAVDQPVDEPDATAVLARRPCGR